LLNAQPREREKNKKEGKALEFSSHVMLRFGGILCFCLLRITRHGALLFIVFFGGKFD